MNKTASAPAMPRSSLRASDADRDRVADALAAALSEGRLSHDEHTERMNAAYSARTVDELAPLTEDLPAGSAPAAAPRPDDSGLVRSPDGTENIHSVLGAAERKGRWLVEPRTNVSVLMGSAVLDMRSAVFAQREVTVQAALILSSLEVVVPPGVRVVNNISDVLGSTSADAGAGSEPYPPTVVLTGTSWLSSVQVKTKEPKASVFKLNRC